MILQNSITAAAEERLKAEHAMKYWQTKLDDESKQLKEAQEAEEVLKVEFEVSPCCFATPDYSTQAAGLD